MSPSRRRMLPWIALVVIYVVWGSTYLAIKLVVDEMPPLAAAGLRFSIAGILMTAIAAWVERDEPRPTRRQLVDYALVGVALLALGNGCVMWAETRIPSSLAALIVATVPLWMTLLDGLRPDGQKWTARAWTGVAIGLLGVGLIVRPEAGIGPREMPGVLALIAASLVWTIASLYAQSVPKRLPVLTASAVEMVAGGLVLLVASPLVGESLAGFGTASPRAWLGLAYLLIFGSLVAFTAFAYCLNELPATTVGTYAYVNPVVAVALGSLVLGEPLSMSMAAGGALILLAVVIATTGRKQPARPTIATLPPEQRITAPLPERRTA
jgi:drug/metabolite transporter (DMT)-like permease